MQDAHGALATESSGEEMCGANFEEHATPFQSTCRIRTGTLPQTAIAAWSRARRNGDKFKLLQMFVQDPSGMTMELEQTISKDDSCPAHNQMILALPTIQ
eukprot:915266-Amphidinium_carterae.1